MVDHFTAGQVLEDGKDEIMSMKWIGAILIIIGCGGAGFYMASQYRRELKMLRQLECALEYMTSELKYRQIPLPQLINAAADRTCGAIRNCLAGLAGELESQIAPDAGSCMKAVLAKAKDIPLRVFNCMELLGSTLGLFDLEGQLAGFSSVHAECNRLITEMEEGKQQRLRSYQTLGLCAGAALAILFA